MGKSSLVNRLFARKKLARTSQTPGCTRSVNYYLVGDRYIVADLPGYGFAKISRQERSAWKGLMDAYLNNVAKIKGFFLLIDSKRSIEPEEEMIFKMLADRKIPGIIVFTKIDRLNQRERAHLHNNSLEEVFSITGREAIYFSSKTGEGKNKLVRSIKELVS